MQGDRPLRIVSHALHLLGEVVLGILGFAALAACILAWRLAQGPIDVSWLVQRERAQLEISGTRLSLGGAALAWEGFKASGQPVVVRLAKIAFGVPGGGPSGTVRQASVGLSLSGLFVGRIAPGSITIEGADITVDRQADGGFGQGTGSRRGTGGPAAWAERLGHFHVADSRLVLHDTATGRSLQASAIDVGFDRSSDGISGTGHLALAAGALAAGALAAGALAAGDTTATLDVTAAPEGAGTKVTAALSPVRLDSLAGWSPRLAALAGIGVPLGLHATALLDDRMQPVSGILHLDTGSGTVAAGKGSVKLAGASATLRVKGTELRLETLRLALAAAHPAAGPGPVITADATATRASGRVHVVFGVAIDSVAMDQLASYWPEGTGGGARAWLTQNVTAGRAHDAHVTGALDAPEDFSDVTIAALSGGLAVDDATLWWLRPVPPIVHVGGHVILEGPDSIRVNIDHGSQDRLVLGAGSFIRITKLEERHQFGDINATLSGPLSDALALLNHPRLKLISRSGVDIVGASGTASAQLTMHVPLEDRVTMDQIPVSATATLAHVHLGRVVAGRDLDDADLSLKVTGDGLALTGTGGVAGIPAKLGLDMDFRAGPADQVLQHLTATGSATAAQMTAAGLPASAVHIVTGGVVDLAVDYRGQRSGLATLQVDADLARTALSVPLGWTKAAGPHAAAGAQILLQHGVVAGVDHLHAEGPQLAIVSRAELQPGQPRKLVLQQLDLGETRAHGEIAFPKGAADPIAVTLSGAMLDISSQLAPATPAKTAQAGPSPDAKSDGEKPDEDKKGQPWSAKLDFDAVELARGKIIAPLHLDAASDGLRILHADVRAGAGQLVAQVVPEPAGRRVSIQAADAGVVLRALGIADNITGGSLKLDGRYDDAIAGSPLSGTATLSEFQLRSAPAIGRLLQAMTLYGVADVMRGPGLHFSRMVAPFRWQNRVLHLTSARAFSSSLGFTAQGDIDLRRHVADVTGTVVPAYFFNQLLGNLPLIGKVFSPEKGGGLFAARYSVRGPLGDPKVGINPLAALTPGFLREGFGLLPHPVPAVPK